MNQDQSPSYVGAEMDFLFPEFTNGEEFSVDFTRSPDSSSGTESFYSSPPSDKNVDFGATGNDGHNPNFSFNPVNPGAQLGEQGKIQVIISHKPRGSKGIWQRVETGDKLRVTKGKGKRLKLEISTNCGSEYDRNNIQLLLIDLENPTPVESKEGFSVESIKTFDNLMEVELKLFKVCKRMQFSLRISTKDGQTLVGNSVDISTHNSGAIGATFPSRVKVESPDELEMESVGAPPPVQPEVSKRKRSDEENLILPPAPVVTTIPGPVSIAGNLDVKGVVQARAFMQFSDLRLKTNVEDIVDAIDIVTQLQGKKYHWKIKEQTPDEQGGKKVIGLIAQEVQKVLPEVVHQDPDTGFLSVSYAEILPVLIEAFKQFLKDFSDEKQDVKKQLTDLEDKIDVLSSRLSISRKNSSVEESEVKSLVSKITGTYREIVSQKNSLDIRKPTIAAPPPAPNFKHTMVKVCKISQIVFAVLFILSLLCVVVGVVLMVENKPTDHALKSSFLPQQTSIIDYSIHYITSRDPNTETTPEDSMRVTWFIIGIILFSVGVLGLLVSGAGLCFSSSYMCYKNCKSGKEEEEELATNMPTVGKPV